MPWHLETDNPGCDGVAVVKDADGSVEGCHASKTDAEAQLAALYASEAESESKAARPPRDSLVRDQRGDFELREEAGGPPILTGHFSVFDQWTEIQSSFEGRFMERVARGAFTRSLRNAGSRIRVTFNHGKDVLGDQLLGVPVALEEDAIGARYEVRLFEGIPPLILNGLRERAYGSSFRFRVLKEDFDPNPKKRSTPTNPDGLPERTILEAQVFEFGPVTYPAYEGATAGIRSGTDAYLLSLLRGATDALPDAGPEPEAHSDEGTRDEPPPAPAPPIEVPAPIVRFRSDEDWIAYLTKESM